MLETLSLIVVLSVGLYFLVLAVFSIANPKFAGRYLLGFAASPAKHYAELVIRFIAGWAFLTLASSSPFPQAFIVFGWLLLITTFFMLAVPWQLHRRFTEFAVPQAIRHIKLIGLSSLAMGAFVVYSAAQSGA